MENHILDTIRTELGTLTKTSASTNLIYRQGHSLYLNGQCAQLSTSENHFEFSVNDKYGDFHVDIDFDTELHSTCNCQAAQICRHSAAALMQLHELIKLKEDEIPASGIKYSRDGMIQRVIDERKSKARNARYAIKYADNIYGEHILTNERKVQYKLTFRDIERKHGYCSCPDYKTNKLGTCKHLIFAFEHLQSDKIPTTEQLPRYPFIEVFLNPFRNYKISWFYPEKIFGEVAELFYMYFGNKKFIEDEEAESLLGFFNNVEKHKQILVRPEVYEKVEKVAELSALKRIEKEKPLDFSLIASKLLPYQKDGIEFASYRKGAIIADEMGLGNILQAVSAAVMKREIFGFNNTLVICPATLKSQWKSEIETLTGEKALIIEGSPEERKKLYWTKDSFFRIVNYETVIRDKEFITDIPVDFLILDEAQRIRNYASLTSTVIQSIPRKHALVVTGTPLESELIDLYSITLFVNPDLLTPLWEFSYQHCYFDSKIRNTVVGYYDLPSLKEKLSDVLIRREKREVIQQLPNISHINIPVILAASQKKMHLKYAREALNILSKKIISSFDVHKSIQLIKQMRMLTDSTFLIDDTSNISPKLDELKHILSYKLHIKTSKRKVVIFTEWEKMINIIARMLRLNKIGFAEVNNNTPAKARREMISRFEEDEQCSIFLSTEAGAEGLDFGMADTIINFETPWSSQQRSQRLGSIDQLGQRAQNLTIINLIAKDSIEEKIADGLEVDDDLINNNLKPEQNVKVVAFPELLQKKYIAALSQSIEQMIINNDADEYPTNQVSGQMKLEFSEEENAGFKSTDAGDPKTSLSQNENTEANEIGRIDHREIEEVLKSGVNFLTQLFKISTGRNVSIKEDQLDFDPETGEITLKFKVPKR